MAIGHIGENSAHNQASSILGDYGQYSAQQAAAQAAYAAQAAKQQRFQVLQLAASNAEDVDATVKRAQAYQAFLDADSTAP